MGVIKVGPYLLLETIGYGSYGKVKHAVHEETGIQYAIKVMRKEKVREKELSEQVRREIYVMSQLNHKNIVKLHQVMATYQKVYIVMELITGGELFDEILSRKRIPENEAKVYFIQLINGLQHCHENGIFHRDLKPENLLLDDEGTLKITDFGLSALLRGEFDDRNEFLLHTQCGTPHYVAPEIISSAQTGYSGDKIDVWSCGIILFLLLSGYLPFDHENPEVLFKQILNAKVDYPQYFSETVIDLLKHLLCIDPKRRYSLKQVRNHAWISSQSHEINAELNREQNNGSRLYKRGSKMVKDSVAGSMATLVSERTAHEYEIEYGNGRALELRQSTANTSYWEENTHVDESSLGLNHSSSSNTTTGSGTETVTVVDGVSVVSNVVPSIKENERVRNGSTMRRANTVLSFQGKGLSEHELSVHNTTNHGNEMMYGKKEQENRWNSNERTIETELSQSISSSDEDADDDEEEDEEKEQYQVIQKVLKMKGLYYKMNSSDSALTMSEQREREGIVKSLVEIFEAKAHEDSKLLSEPLGTQYPERKRELKNHTETAEAARTYFESGAAAHAAATYERSYDLSQLNEPEESQKRVRKQQDLFLDVKEVRVRPFLRVRVKEDGKGGYTMMERAEEVFSRAILRNPKKPWRSDVTNPINNNANVTLNTTTQPVVASSSNAATIGATTSPASRSVSISDPVSTAGGRGNGMNERMQMNSSGRLLNVGTSASAVGATDEMSSQLMMVSPDPPAAAAPVSFGGLTRSLYSFSNAGQSLSSSSSTTTATTAPNPSTVSAHSHESTTTTATTDGRKEFLEVDPYRPEQFYSSLKSVHSVARNHEKLKSQNSSTLTKGTKTTTQHNMPSNVSLEETFFMPELMVIGAPAVTSLKMTKDGNGSGFMSPKSSQTVDTYWDSNEYLEEDIYVRHSPVISSALPPLVPQSTTLSMSPVQQDVAVSNTEDDQMSVSKQSGSIQSPGSTGGSTTLGSLFRVVNTLNVRRYTQFNTTLSCKNAAEILSEIMTSLGCKYTLIRRSEITYKMKLEVKIQKKIIFARVELYPIDFGLTAVSFRRARADRNGIENKGFLEFYRDVYRRFCNSTNAQVRTKDIVTMKNPTTQSLPTTTTTTTPNPRITKNQQMEHNTVSHRTSRKIQSSPNLTSMAPHSKVVMARDHDDDSTGDESKKSNDRRTALHIH